MSNRDPNTWHINEGKSSKPPTNKLVHIQLSTFSDGGVDYDIRWNQNPHAWDWLKQPTMIRRWVEAETATEAVEQSRIEQHARNLAQSILEGKQDLDLLAKRLGWTSPLTDIFELRPGERVMLRRALQFYLRFYDAVKADKKRPQWERDEAVAYIKAAGELSEKLRVRKGK